MQRVLRLLEPLRLSPTGGRDTEFPTRLYFRMHRLPLNACSIQMLVQGKSMPYRQERLWQEWDVQWRLDGAGLTSE